MSYVIGFLGTKEGQGVTTTAVAVADRIARRHSVLLIDADMSGTGTAADTLHLDPMKKGMNRLLGQGPITAEALIEESVAGLNQRLAVVPGLTAIAGSDIASLIDRLERGAAFQHLPHDFAVLDLGAPWAHPWLRSPREAAEAVARVCNRVLVLLLDSPSRLARGIQVLQAAQPPRAELILLESRRGSLTKQAREAIRYNLPDLALAARVRWDLEKAMAAEDKGIPMPEVGEHLIKSLRIVDSALPSLSRPDASSLEVMG